MKILGHNGIIAKEIYEEDDMDILEFMCEVINGNGNRMFAIIEQVSQILRQNNSKSTGLCLFGSRSRCGDLIACSPDGGDGFGRIGRGKTLVLCIDVTIELFYVAIHNL